MKKLTFLSAVVLVAVSPTTASFADVSIRADIRTEDPIGEDRARRIVINTSNNEVGVCGLTGTVTVYGRDRRRPLCTYRITRASVSNFPYLSPINLHTSGSGCVGATSYPLVVVDLIDNPGVTVKFYPENGEPYGDCYFDEDSYTFCTEGNDSSPCVEVRDFDLDISAD